MSTEGSLLQYAADGRARVIATSGATRSQFLPDVPTFTEQGIANIAVKEWFGLFMPPGASAAIVNRAADAVRNALAQREITDLLAKSGMTAAATTPAELVRTMRAENEYWGANVRAAAFTALD
jgi:tripartite-type tricarboxylate transporter receptor subunit TctC